MHLTHGELVNFRQHEQLEIPINGHLIGVVGPNGKGKSNLLGSMQYALTGDIPGVTKEKLLRWGAEDGYAQWTFEHDGSTAVVHRALGNGQTWLRVNDGKKITGITNVNQALFDMAGLDKDVGRMIFVQQAMLDQVLFDLPSKREQAFQKLCGMGDANKIHRDVGNFLSVRMPEVPDYTEQMAEAERQKVEYTNQQKELNLQLNQLGASVPPSPSEELQARVGECDVALPLFARLKDVLASQINIQNSLNALAAEAATLRADGADVPLERIDAEIQKIQQIVDAIEAYMRAKAAFEQANLERNNVGAPPVDDATLTELEDASAALITAYQQAQGRITLYRQLLSTLSKPGVDLSECPVCGSKITDPAFVTQHLQSLISTAEAEAVKFDPTTKQAEYRSLSQQLGTYNMTKAAVDQKVTSADQALKAVDTARFGSTENLEATLAQKRAEIAGIREIRQDVATKQARLNSIDGQTTALQSHLTRGEASRAAITTQLKQFMQGRGWTDAELNSDAAITTRIDELDRERATAKEALQTWQNYQVQRANLDGQIKQLQGNLLRVDKTIEGLEYKRSQQGTFRDVIDVLTDVRDFFHYNQGPHRLAVSILDEMNKDVNMFLQKMNAPYSVLAHDTGLTYLCQFHDGRPMPDGGFMEATELSGGEKVLLAVSFRLASYMMFAGKMGLLSLDEPTAYLDDNNISNFCELLNTLKDVARSLDLQLIMSTHERATIPFLDDVIDLGTTATKTINNENKDETTN